MRLPSIVRRPALWLYTWGEARDPDSGLVRQTAALPWRGSAAAGLEVLLVTGRKSRRWIVPKGWPMRGKTLAEAAAQEAFEEAGVRGSVHPVPLGTFTHIKRHPFVGAFEVSILVHALALEEELPAWPEQGQRDRQWFGIAEAASAVRSKELAELIRKLPQRL